MSGVREYYVVSGVSTDDLKALVDKGIANGWVPQGGVAVAYDPANGQIFFYQAMVLPS